VVTEVLQGDKRQPHVLAEFVDTDDAAVMQPGDRCSFPAKAFYELAVGDFGENLEGDGPSGVAIKGPKGFDDGALVDFRFDFVLADAGGRRPLQPGEEEIPSVPRCPDH